MQTHRTVQDDTGLYKTENADMLLHRVTWHAVSYSDFVIKMQFHACLTELQHL